MPTNLYGPNDNFDLEKSHVLPAMLRKMHLGKCLEENNWEAIREDLNKRPIEGISGSNTNDDILTILSKYGIRINQATEPVEGALPEPVEGISVEIWGTGTPMREFLWSEEMADACVFLIENINFKDVISTSSITEKKPFPEPVEGKSLSHEVRNTHINIGTGKEISIHDLAFLIKEKLGFKGNLEFNTSKPDGTMRKLTNPDKLHALGWHHQIEIEEGIEKLYHWYLGHEST
jgi:GDP-L-fucose synthase